MTKNIKFVITRFVFPSSKCTKIRIPPPNSPPHSMPSASRTRRLGAYGASILRPLNTKSWLSQCV